MRRVDRLVLLLSVAAITIQSAPAYAQPYHRRIPPAQVTAEHQSLLAMYECAIFNSAVYDSTNLRRLRPLVADSNGEVIVATLTSADGKVGELLPVTGTGVWVTGVPEVQEICRGFSGDVVMKVRQLLGLPPDAHVPRVLVLRVKIADVFRAAVDPNVSSTTPCEQLQDAPRMDDCGNVFPSDTTPSHYAWMASQSFELHALPDGYPWTHLGYTFNWAPDADRYGASEYVVRPGARALIVGNERAEAYCRPPDP
jgi:hypothetical protein